MCRCCPCSLHVCVSEIQTRKKRNPIRSLAGWQNSNTSYCCFQYPAMHSACWVCFFNFKNTTKGLLSKKKKIDTYRLQNNPQSLASASTIVQHTDLHEIFLNMKYEIIKNSTHHKPQNRKYRNRSRL